MKIIFAADHAGYELKQALITQVKDMGHEVEDVGAFSYEPEDDYPDYISEAARRVSENPDTLRAIVIGGSGQGEAMVANRFPRVRTAVFYGGDESTLTLSREHNDANVLSLAARSLTEDQAKQAVEKWLSTPFSNEERHVRRIAKIENYP